MEERRRESESRQILLAILRNTPIPKTANWLQTVHNMNRLGKKNKKERESETRAHAYGKISTHGDWKNYDDN